MRMFESFSRIETFFGRGYGCSPEMEMMMMMMHIRYQTQRTTKVHISFNVTWSRLKVFGNMKPLQAAACARCGALRVVSWRRKTKRWPFFGPGVISAWLKKKTGTKPKMIKNQKKPKRPQPKIGCDFRCLAQKRNRCFSRKRSKNTQQFTYQMPSGTFASYIWDA